jgi:hypothetical protein
MGYTTDRPFFSDYAVRHSSFNFHFDLQMLDLFLYNNIGNLDSAPKQ